MNYAEMCVSDVLSSFTMGRFIKPLGAAHALFIVQYIKIHHMDSGHYCALVCNCLRKSSLARRTLVYGKTAVFNKPTD